MSSGSRPVVGGDLGDRALLVARSSRPRGLDDLDLVPLAVEEAKRRRRRQLGAHAVAKRPVGEHRLERRRRDRPSAGFQLARPSTGYGEASVKSIVSGQHDTWPSMRWPRALAAAIASRSSNTASRVDAVVQQRGDHHRPAGRRGERFEERHRRVRRPWSACRRRGRLRPSRRPAPPSRRRSASREGIGRPPSPLCAGLVLLAKPTAPCAIASRTIACICAISSARRRAPGGVVAHHVGAHRRMADVGGDVGDASRARAAAPGTRGRSRSPSRCRRAARRSTCPRPASGSASSARGRPAGTARS